MEEKPFKAMAKSLSPHDSSKSGSKGDIRNLWTRATLSQPRLNIQLTDVYEDLDPEDSSEDWKAGQWYKQPSSDGGAWEGWSERTAEAGTRQEELDAYTSEELERSPQRGDVEGLEDFGSKMDFDASVSSVNIMKHTHHRAYWREQQNRMPLPLLELMENEVLEILTKALRTYQSEIGRDHFLTKQLQRYIEGLRKRRNRRLHVSAH
ncbi:cation channel sperm-associated protein subunit zeta isoform X2 [Pipistrellus kuhlii]|uniref:Catsper channel auxiliary subunit zeta n=1 Tax=Pipistrellus kuhlii TaxID=59472 RepID=A0A7J7RTQ8_PIPKU|nr:cation channel sperm-associated protein subunit zeta isoform X2 [Pipistrellus kuhlii]KAF6279397.1 catsper channel auxiliary subunit zeta [Pipistrellus kuhlii]